MPDLPSPVEFKSLPAEQKLDAHYEAMHRLLGNTQKVPMTVREFAQHKGVSRSTVYRWERQGLIQFKQTEPVRIGWDQLTKI